jgi:hypothetical protein
MSLHVTFSECGPDALELLPTGSPSHRARIDEFVTSGAIGWSLRERNEILSDFSASP